MRSDAIPDTSSIYGNALVLGDRLLDRVIEFFNRLPGVVRGEASLLIAALSGNEGVAGKVEAGQVWIKAMAFAPPRDFRCDTCRIGRRHAVSRGPLVYETRETSPFSAPPICATFAISRQI